MLTLAHIILCVMVMCAPNEWERVDCSLVEEELMVASEALYRNRLYRAFFYIII